MDENNNIMMNNLREWVDIYKTDRWKTNFICDGKEFNKPLTIEIWCNNDLLSKNVSFKSKTVLNSNSIEEYDNKVEINRLEKENERLSKNIKKLKEQNKELKTKNNKIKKQNKEIINSKSWKLTKTFRDAKKVLKK